MNNFNQLIEHKSQFISSKIITIEEIISNKEYWVNGLYGDATNESNGNPWIKNGHEVFKNHSLFNDTQAKIRNFIRFAYDSWNTTYILLGGDYEHLPGRRLYCYLSNWTNSVKIKPIHSSILSDHYYSALNGSWNHDCDTRFGEKYTDSIDEEADFESEVYVGRAPVNDKNDVNVFVQKVISYETTEKPHKIQVHQSYIKPNKIPDTVPVAENCIHFVPSTYIIKRLYERDGIVTSDQWIDSFQMDDTFLFYQIGNGYNDEIFSWYQLSWNGERRELFSILDVGELHNTFYPIHMSISCQTSDFSENECLAEELLLTQYGGASACIGNTEVGCLNKTNATKYSSEFFERMFYEIFINNTKKLGPILQTSKQHFISNIHQEDQYRWCFYELILLGDPETPILETRPSLDKNNTTYHVDNEYTPLHPGWNNTHFTSIQKAHDHIEEFGTIIIHPGTYTEHVTITKTITMKGVDKETTFLTNTNNTPIITLQCHTTTITNLTIKNSQTLEIPEKLLLIKEGFNGNRISNLIITGDAHYGILIKDSIRNTIKNNLIQHTTYGIGIINALKGLLPSSVTVTCDNIITENKIQYNRHCGLYIEGSIHNYITHNYFKDNGQENHIEKRLYNENNICLIKTKLNTIHGNYWDKPRDNPYKIWSIHGPIIIFTVDISKGLLFKYYKCVLILNIGFPFPLYDSDPL